MTRRVVVAGVALFGAAVFVLIATMVGTVARGILDPQWNVALADVMGGDPDAVDPSTDVVAMSTIACTEDVPCVEAFDTAEATYYRFATRADAAAFAATVEDGFTSNYIVMDFAGKDDVSPERQLWAMQYLAGYWQDYEGDFPDR